MPKTSPERLKSKAQTLVKSLQRNNFNLTNTAKEFGVTRQSIRDKIVKNPIVKSELQKLYDRLDKVGATDDKVAKRINEGLDAVKVIRSQTGEVIDEDPDHAIRLKSVDFMCRLKRYIGDTESQNVNVGEMKVMIVNGSSGNQETFLRSPQRESVRDTQASGEVPSSGLR